MNTTPENVLDELLIQVKVVHAQLLIKTNTPRHCSRNFRYLYGWTRNTNNASWRLQASSAIRYGGTLFRKNFGNFRIPPTKRWYYSKIKTTNRQWHRDIVSSNCWTTRKRAIQCAWLWVDHKDRIHLWPKPPHIKILRIFNTELWKYVRNGTFAHTWGKSVQSWFGENWTPDTSTSETISTVCETII